MKILMLLISFSLFSAAAHAEIYIEPYVGYSFGTESGSAAFTAPAAGTATATGKDSQALYGARLGYSTLVVAFGGEYLGGKLSTKSTSTVVTTGTAVSDSTSSGALTGLGAFVALNLPIVRAFATYFPSVKTKDGGDSETGSGFKVGVGYSALPFLAVNAEMLSMSMTKGDISGLTLTSYSNKYTIYMLSVSLPLSF